MCTALLLACTAAAAVGADVQAIDAEIEEAKSFGIPTSEFTDCHTALRGEECYAATTWAKHDGIFAHPEWYPGLSRASSFEEFQATLNARGLSGCQVPCGMDAATQNNMSSKGSNASNEGLSNGCSTGVFPGGLSRSSLCFCQLAQNPECAKQPCACPQGCGAGIGWKNAESVTFKNRARAQGCNPSTVLLTAPRAYFGTPADLKSCGQAALPIIETLLRDSWNMYQTHVGNRSLHQCFHGSHIASVQYLHMQSFCSSASFHAMPNANHYVGSCVKMLALSEVPSLAKQLYNMMQ
eukprot:TRINITY_DN7515_c0_g1_i2.p1 TRINITY_DN7515_c0_g1~~TRINITY_DN7515_c0_g1_i2.p1  ORF type:complete len:295 (-),score=53.82 TRINITY_DN7515_c0_g1_i2:50-934(-)